MSRDMDEKKEVEEGEGMGVVGVVGYSLIYRSFPAFGTARALSMALMVGEERSGMVRLILEMEVDWLIGW